MAYAHLGHIGISAQQSFGTATNSFEYFPIINESLTTGIEQLVEEGMRARFEEGPTHEGLLTVAGDIVFEPHPIIIGHFLRGFTGQASSTLVDSVTTWEFLPKQSDFDDKVIAPPYTLEVFRDIGSAWQFTDSIVNALTFEITAGAIVKCTASMLCRISSLAPKSTPSFPEGDPWTWDAVSLSIGGTANSDVEAMTITYENNTEGVSFLDNTKLHGKYKRTGFRNFSLSGTFDLANQDEYNAFRSQSERNFIVTVTGASLTTSQSNVLKFDMPKVRYTAYPVNMGGPGRITVSAEGTCKYDTTSLYALNTTMTNTREAYTP